MNRSDNRPKPAPATRPNPHLPGRGRPHFLCHLVVAGAIVGALTGCETTPTADRMARAEIAEKIRNEEPGDYYIGRRYYKVDYKFWGYVRRPREPWSKARMVMLNEQQKLAPDRAANQIGSDNNHEYRMRGWFSGDTVYEPASNGFYPEFVLTDIELIDDTPPPIYRTRVALDPKIRVIAKPY